MDALSRILRSVRLGSSLISRARLTAPWGVRSPGAPRAIFHAVLRGRCFVRRDGDAEATPLGPGDVVVLAHGDAHVMSDDPSTRPASIDLLRPRRDGALPLLEHGGGGTETRLICGKFELDHDGGAALLRLLPPLLHARADGAELAPWVDTTLRMLEAEVEREDAGVAEMLSRLTDILFVQVLRRHVASAPTQARGWLAALRDPQIGQALALIHAEPASRWSASTLASRVGLSRTRFFEQFTEAVGEPPARYLARWRVHNATDLMRRGSLSTAAVAELVGYSSEDAFTKVFKRHLGVSPSAFRRRLQREPPARRADA